MTRIETGTSSAAQLFQQGRDAYDAQDYLAAVAAFRGAYELSMKPELLFNIAQALRQGQRCEEALAYYDQYREAGQVPSDFDDLRGEAERCAEAQRGRRSLEARNASVPVAEPVQASESSPKSAATTRLASPRTESASPSSPSAPHGVPASAHGAAAPTRSGWSRTRWMGISALTIGVASGVAGVVLAVDAKRASDATSRLSRDGGNWNASAEANQRSGRAFAAWSVVLLTTSAVTTAAGLWLSLRSEPTSSAHVALVLQPGGAALDWCSTF